MTGTTIIQAIQIGNRFVITHCHAGTARSHRARQRDESARCDAPHKAWIRCHAVQKPMIPYQQCCSYLSSIPFRGIYTEGDYLSIGKVYQHAKHFSAMQTACLTHGLRRYQGSHLHVLYYVSENTSRELVLSYAKRTCNMYASTQSASFPEVSTI